MREKELFLKLIRAGIGTDSGESLKDFSIDWSAIKTLADRQGVSAVVLDGLNKCHTDTTDSTEMLPLQMKLEWIGEVLQNYEARYNAYEKAIGSLAGWYNQHRFKMMVIKGYGLSMNWPKPNHRPCGDIDIWLFGEQKKADGVIAEECKIKIDNEYHQHTVFSWNGFTVENHYNFLNVHYGHNNAELEKVLRELAKDDSNRVEIGGHPVYLPSANLHALFLLRHSLTDFASSELTLRQVLDWAFFVEKHTKEIDWEWLRGIITEYKMTDFFSCLNAICVGDLGFSPDIFGTVQFDPFLKEKVLKDIIQPAFTRSTEGRGFFERIVFKYRRWQGNAWKQELCYHDSRWSAFWSGVWNHLLKPRTI